MVTHSELNATIREAPSRDHVVVMYLCMMDANTRTGKRENGCCDGANVMDFYGCDTLNENGDERLLLRLAADNQLCLWDQHIHPTAVDGHKPTDLFPKTGPPPCRRRSSGTVCGRE